MINFPDAPAVNDVFQDWKWDGSSWGKVPTLAEPVAAAGYKPWALRNGVWVPGIDKQIVDLSGINTVDVKLRHISSTMNHNVRISSVVYSSTAQLQMRWSSNGTSWSTAADSYRYAGMYHSSTGGYANMPQTSATAVPTSYGTPGTNLAPALSQMWFDRIMGRGYVQGLSELASSQVITMLIRCWGNLASGNIQYLRFFSHDGTNFETGSYAVVEEVAG